MCKFSKKIRIMFKKNQFFYYLHAISWLEVILYYIYLIINSVIMKKNTKIC